MLYNWIFTVNKKYAMVLLQALFDLCALDVRIDEESIAEYRIECKGPSLDDLCDRLEFYGNMPSSYFELNAACSTDNATSFYKIANYSAYTDEVTRLITIDA